MGDASVDRDALTPPIVRAKTGENLRRTSIYFLIPSSIREYQCGMAKTIAEQALEADMANVAHNDTGLPLEAVKGRLSDGVEIKYGDLVMVTERGSYEKVRADVAGWSSEERRRAQVSVDLALRRGLPKLRSGKRIKKRVADNFHSDLILWDVLKGEQS